MGISGIFLYILYLAGQRCASGCGRNTRKSSLETPDNCSVCMYVFRILQVNMKTWSVLLNRSRIDNIQEKQEKWSADSEKVVCSCIRFLIHLWDVLWTGQGKWGDVERAVFSLKEADGGMQACYGLFTLSLWLLSYPVDSTGIAVFIYQGKVKAALIQRSITSLNDFTEVILKVCNSKRKQERKTRLDDYREISVRKVKSGVHFHFYFLLQVSSSWCPCVTKCTYTNTSLQFDRPTYVTTMNSTTMQLVP